MHICTYAHMHICTYAHMHICTYAHMHICTHARTHARTHACTHTRAHTHTDIQLLLQIPLIAPEQQAYLSRAQLPQDSSSISLKKKRTAGIPDPSSAPTRQQQQAPTPAPPSLHVSSLTPVRPGILVTSAKWQGVFTCAYMYAWMYDTL